MQSLGAPLGFQHTQLLIRFHDGGQGQRRHDRTAKKHKYNHPLELDIQVIIPKYTGTRAHLYAPLHLFSQQQHFPPVCAAISYLPWYIHMLILSFPITGGSMCCPRTFGIGLGFGFRQRLGWLSPNPSNLSPFYSKQ